MSALKSAAEVWEAINARIARTDGCWLWAGSVTDGRGRYRDQLAYRLVYEHYRGPIPTGFLLHHTCLRPLCVNPWHLEAKARNVHSAEHNHRDVCRRGHPMVNPIIHVRADRTSRACRICVYAANAAWKRARRAA